MLIAVAAMVAIAGCGSPQPDEPTGEELSEDTGANVSNVQTGESYHYEVKLTEKNQNQLVRAQPPQTMEYSLERQNLIKRYEYLNDRNNVHHVYLVDEGQIVGYYVAQGKVSSVNSKLTNNKQIVQIENARFDRGNGAGGANGANYKVVESPQMDGSYGTNGAAIFFFTTSGEYVETNLDYVVSEEPRSLTDEPILVEQADSGSGNETDG
jgi:hypothetical protein